MSHRIYPRTNSRFITDIFHNKLFAERATAERQHCHLYRSQDNGNRVESLPTCPRVQFNDEGKGSITERDVIVAIRRHIREYATIFVSSCRASRFIS